ncbi:galactosyl transferase GMA12/MNN10 family-domain-containing protein [Podospora appendiculata]|uniref:Galactosyl transferase GMA12/MNN10 family-domain-containing protein n=1 Tax=Podospora appendiculata TaxID=314037 RepID=A0AAE0X2L8_9PEZI|nr:galactosyl transferase GMA12/MNN10 family-domain-containing protein [Podospora appendiculata]
MHFAYPPRKTSNPPPFLPRQSKLPGLLARRSRLKVIALAGLAFIAVIYIIARLSGRHGGAAHHKPSGRPPVVLVTVLDEKKYSKAYIDTVKDNRIQYAEKHGYKTFFAKASDYELKGAPPSWASVVATRHALTLFPDCYFVWYLDQNSFVMNPLLRIEDHVMKASRLEALMIKDQPVVPPDSIIKTFSHLKGQDVDFVLTQDKEGLSTGSFVLRNGEWAKYLLETWFDPIYRSYNFQKAETHALEHIVQWHPTILARLALVDQHIINSYSKDSAGAEYKDGDIAVRFADCTPSGAHPCEAESQRFAQQWRSNFKNA